MAQVKGDIIIITRRADTIGGSQKFVAVEQLVPTPKSGCVVSFEARASNDITVFFLLAEEETPSVQVIFGSHRNTKTIVRVSREGSFKQFSSEDSLAKEGSFKQFWIAISSSKKEDSSIIQCGSGMPPLNMSLHCEVPFKLPVKKVAFASYDSPVLIRASSLKILPALRLFSPCPADLVPSLFETCLGIVVDMVPTLGIGPFLAIVGRLGVDRLDAAILKVLRQQFCQCCREFAGEFRKIDETVFRELLSSSSIRSDGELEILKAVLAYSRGKEGLLEDFLQLVRFPLMTAAERTQAAALIGATRDPDTVNMLLEDAKVPTSPKARFCVRGDCLAVREEADTLQNLRRTPRRPFGHFVPFFGDYKGIFHWLGVHSFNAGRGKWEKRRYANPHPSVIRVCASTPENRTCNYSSVVGEAALAHNFASGRPPWWLVDLKECRAKLETVVLWGSSSEPFPAKWLLEASEDGEEWQTLFKTQEPISTPVLELPVLHQGSARFLRIRALVAGSFILLRMELFGYVINVKEKSENCDKSA